VPAQRAKPNDDMTPRQLAALTIGWNTVEAVVAIAAAAAAGSTALLGFGVDSVIESASGAVVFWRFTARGDSRERIAQRLIGVSLLLLAAYVGIEAVRALLVHEMPESSIPGVVLSAVSVVAMPLLARAKRRANRSIGSGALHADSHQTDLCAYLSAILLAGLVLNAAAGWWWADPLATLAMVPIIAIEGVRTLKARQSCCA
jgi:divalent metal cation (Fe/Co/Zn/Cd) transporter